MTLRNEDVGWMRKIVHLKLEAAVFLVMAWEMKRMGWHDVAELLQAKATHRMQCRRALRRFRRSPSAA